MNGDNNNKDKLSELKQKLQRHGERPPQGILYSENNRKEYQKYMTRYVAWERERDAIIEEIKNIYKDMPESDFVDKDGWGVYVSAQNDKIAAEDGRGARGLSEWWDGGGYNKIWKKHGKPLAYYAYEYVADDQINCSYCNKPLAMYHGSPDLSACDVVCFECFKERTNHTNDT